MELRTNSVIPQVKLSRPMAKPTAFRGLIIVPNEHEKIINEIIQTECSQWVSGGNITGFFANGKTKQRILKMLSDFAKETKKQATEIFEYLPEIKTIKDFIGFEPKPFGQNLPK